MKQENQDLEYKRTWNDEYLKWICGLDNAKGGTIYIGIDDDGTILRSFLLPFRCYKTRTQRLCFTTIHFKENGTFLGRNNL